MEKEIGNLDDIVLDAYYLISLFNKDEEKVTQLQIQKLMYFFEAYYMVKNDVNKLYDDNFCAWTFGPVSTQLYSEFKMYGQMPIILTDEQKELGSKIPREKKEMLKEIYSTFKDFTAMRLVELTHTVGSPWYDVWKKNGEKVVYGPSSCIDKIKTREWFKANFVNVNSY